MTDTGDAYTLDRRRALAILMACLAGVRASPAAGPAADDSALQDAVEKLVSGDSWRRLIDMLSKLEPAMRDQPRLHGALERAEAVRFLLRNFETVRMTQIELRDPAYPRLVRLFDTYANYGDINPDSDYQYATVSPAFTYRIHGSRGSARILDVQCMAGEFTDPHQRGRAFLSDIQGKDGKVEVLLSTTPHDGNWVKLDPDVRFIYVRQYYYDWETEQPGELAIERIGAVYPPPPPTAADIAAGLEGIIQTFPAWSAHIINDVMARHYKTGTDDVFWMHSPSGMANNYYGNGRYELSHGEVMVLELQPPKAAYWNIYMLNDFGETTRWDVRQVSLNGMQMRVDDDGVFRAVISPVDPGVPNWLDTEGRTSGLYTIRVLRPAEKPQLKISLVSLAELRKRLPRTTPSITPEARSEALRRRMLGAFRRFRQ